jgi:histone deacetylase complex regulatory component SIN3
MTSFSNKIDSSGIREQLSLFLKTESEDFMWQRVKIMVKNKQKLQEFLEFSKYTKEEFIESVTCLFVSHVNKAFIKNMRLLLEKKDAIANQEKKKKEKKKKERRATRRSV